MANEEHLKIFRQGVDVWNEWRKENPEIVPDLTEAKLPEANLRDVNLEGADLRGADLWMANLRAANLKEARLNAADLKGAILIEVKLNAANLIGAYLDYSILTDANFTNATIGATSFGENNLSTVKGLETINHSGSSIIGIHTIYRSQGKIPESFLRGAGIPDNFIKYIGSIVGEDIEYFSCFISYSSQDEEFAESLYNYLLGEGVNCWFAREHMKIGDKIRSRIDESIRRYDKLLIILSKNSVNSDWVEKEVETAFEKEMKTDTVVLFPIRLDNAVMETDVAWAADIRRTRYIGDFTNLKNPEVYKKAYDRLLRDLKGEETA